MRVARVSSLTILPMMTLAALGVMTHDQTQTPAATQNKAAATQQPTPVVVELFTSEGCSSCPPADDLLTMLVRNQPLAGAQIIAFGEHVDYWDRLGWRDQFSSAQFTARQNEYAQRAFHTDIYTPQMVVNGEQQVLGSDPRAVQDAITKAAQRQPRVALSLTIPTDATTDHHAPTELRVQLQATVAPGTKLDEPTELLLAVTEEGLGSHVLRGENGGRDLHHGTVLRTLTPVGTFAAKEASWSGTKVVTLGKDWNPHQVRIAALAQAQKSRRILGAAIVPLDRGSQTTASH